MLSRSAYRLCGNPTPPPTAPSPGQTAFAALGPPIVPPRCPPLHTGRCCPGPHTGFAAIPLHPQLRHRPAKLRLRPLARQLFRHAAHPFTPVDAVPVRIQALRQSRPPHPALQYVIAGPRRLLLEELRPHLVGRVIDHHHQHRLGSPPFKPVVVRSVQLHHHPKTGFAFPPGPLPLPPPPHLPRPLGDQPPPQGLVIHLQTLPRQILRRQRRPKIRIPLLVARQHPLP